jgi:maltose alpha-D-glucosyltransferase/alpha-amylase
MKMPSPTEVSEQTVAADWYKDAVIYQLHVRSFFDSNNDGIGDFKGLAQKLDYLQDLGVTAIWLLPFYPSPLRDDGYDIADYRSVNPVYGDLKDFKAVVSAAHERGLRIITEVVLNHTSDQHPWFQRARRAKPGSPARDFYVWSDTPEKYRDVRIIFKDFETSNWSWDPVAQAYYWHRFFNHQPDLNFDNPKVREAALGAVDFWLQLGVDGLRLDAIPYLFEREGTSCENLPETHAFLKELRAHVDKKYFGRMLLAEANQWPEDAIAYFGDGDECHTAFHFPVMPRLFMAIHMEDRFPILDILQQTPAIPENCQWVVFLRNHDELTLEMVTDEERDYMYRVYAHDRQARINLGIRRRLAPLLENNRPKIELMNGLLCSLPGTPVIYYGDEIGMGDNIYLGDRNGVRTPMQWSPDRNAGFSAANPQQLYSPVIIDAEYLFETVNVETQQKNPHSLLWWMRRLIGVRQRFAALGRGTFEPLYPENSKVLAFLRRYADEVILVVANLSRFAQCVELDLSPFAQFTPIEVFGQTRFPQVGEAPYLLTLSPYAFYWFSLEPQQDHVPQPADTPKLLVDTDWFDLCRRQSRRSLESAFTKALPTRRWFDGTVRAMHGVHILDIIPLDRKTVRGKSAVLLAQVNYLEGEPETYALLVGDAWGEAAEKLKATVPESIIAQLERRSTRELGVLAEGFVEGGRANGMLEVITRSRELEGTLGQVVGWSSSDLPKLAPKDKSWTWTTMKAEQSNTSIVFEDQLLLKFFRRLNGGVNPELEIGRELNSRATEAHVPELFGALTYLRAGSEPMTLGVLQKYVPNTVNAWQFTTDWVGRYLENVLTQTDVERPTIEKIAKRSFWRLASGDAPELAKELLGGYLEFAALLGRRMAELHIALGAVESPGFEREPFSQFHQRSLYQTARSLAFQTLRSLRRALKTLPENAHDLARQVLAKESTLQEALREILNERLVAPRIRCHGDFDLEQVLYTGKDFLFIDFEGRPERPVAARRILQCPLHDVASMIRSLHDVAVQSALRAAETSPSSPPQIAARHDALDFWYVWSSSALLKAYTGIAAGADLLPTADAHSGLLLHFYLLENALVELQEALAGEPKDMALRLQGLLDLLRWQE